MTYSRRQLAKQAKIFSKLLVPTRRFSMNKRYEENAARVIAEKPEEFDKDYFKDLASRYFDLEKSYWNMQLVYIIIAAFLASRLLGGAEISLFGLSIKSPNILREPLLFALTILAMILAMQLQQLDKMRFLLKTYSHLKCPEIPSLYAAKFAHFVPGELYIPNPDKDLTMGPLGKFILSMFVVLFILMFIAIVCISGIVGFINAYDVYQNPSQYKYLSYATVVFYFLAWIFSAVVMIIDKLPFTYRDYSLVTNLMEMKKDSEEKHSLALKKLSHEAFIKAGLKSPHDDIFKGDTAS